VLGSVSPPAAILALQSETLRDATKERIVEDFRHMQLDSTLTLLTDVEGGCERIKNTPLPRQYDYYPRAFLRSAGRSSETGAKRWRKGFAARVAGG